MPVGPVLETIMYHKYAYLWAALIETGKKLSISNRALLKIYCESS